MSDWSATNLAAATGRVVAVAFMATATATTPRASDTSNAAAITIAAITMTARASVSASDRAGSVLESASARAGKVPIASDTGKQAAEKSAAFRAWFKRSAK